MNDQPPSDKKPRRRGAPRKRAPAKRAAKKVEAPSVVASPVAAAAPTPTAGVADPTGASKRAVDATPARPRRATQVDPAARAEARGRNDGDVGAPADTSTATMPLAPVVVPVSEAAVRPTQTAAAVTPTQTAGAGDAATSDDAGALSLSEAEREQRRPARNDVDTVPSPTVTAPTTAQTTALSDPGAAPAAATATAPHAQRTAEPIKRQDALRPGELIRVPLSVRWRDLDAFNHVNNSKYLSYLEEARLRWMLSVPGMGLDDNVAPVVAASNLNYRRPVEWPGDVVIELFVERLGGSSLTIGHRIVDANEGGVVYCDGNVVMVWIDRTTGRSAPLPEGVRAACR